MRREIKLPDITPRPYQVEAEEMAIDLVKQSPEIWHLFQSPTGTGKSFIELSLLKRMKDWILVTPRIEIIAGMLDKCGHYVEDMSNKQIVDLSASYGIFTPIRLRNLLSKGDMPFMPEGIIVDEAHHDLADSYQDITMYLNGIPKLGFTASAYRGSPRATAAFHSQWNDTVNQILTLEAAIEGGYCSLPIASIWPLVDDDVIEVTNGEIKASAADAVITNHVDSLIDRIKEFYNRKARMYDKPTMIALPTTNLVNKVTTGLNQLGLPAVSVTQDTPRKDRASAFANVVNCLKILVQIDVVSEGVDLPLRRLIDLRPTMSPVKWIQQIGRIMRPISITDNTAGMTEYPEYICCCRNLERHGYLMEGLLPIAIIKESQEIFKTPSKRSGMRAVGLEGLGRFTSTPVQLMNGVSVVTYSLVTMNDYKRVEYFVMVHPNQMDPIYGIKESTRDGDSIKWGKWSLIQSIPDVKGFASAKPYPLTDPQQKRWNELAEHKGLNPHQKVTNRNIQTLFFLLNTGLKLR